MENVDEKFKTACHTVRENVNAKISEIDKKRLYLFYKVAIGELEPTENSPPGEKKKYCDILKICGGRVGTKEDAKKQYISLVDRLKTPDRK